MKKKKFLSDFYFSCSFMISLKKERFETLGLICLYINVSVVRCHTRSKLLIHVGYNFIDFKQIWLMTLLQDEVIKIHSNVLSEKIIVKFTIITKNNSFMPFSTSYIGDLSLLLLHPFTITINTIYIFYTQKFSQTTNIIIKSWSHLILYYESQNIKYIEICFLHKFKTSKYR